MLQRLALLRQRSIHCLLAERPVQFIINLVSRLSIEGLFNEFIGNVLRKRIAELWMSIKPSNEIIDGCLSTIARFCNLSTAEPVHIVEPEYFLVVHE